MQHIFWDKAKIYQVKSMNHAEVILCNKTNKKGG